MLHAPAAVWTDGVGSRLEVSGLSVFFVLDRLAAEAGIGHRAAHGAKDQIDAANSEAETSLSILIPRATERKTCRKKNKMQRETG